MIELSLASYIGTNVQIPLSVEDSDDLVVIGDCFSIKYNRQDVKKYQFNTPYIYEVSSHWGIEISEDINERICNESKKKLIELCKIMDMYLEKGDFFELYSCWIGEEADKREGDLTLELNNFDINLVRLPEKTLVRFVKS